MNGKQGCSKTKAGGTQYDDTDKAGHEENIGRGGAEKAAAMQRARRTVFGPEEWQVPRCSLRWRAWCG